MIFFLHAMIYLDNILLKKLHTNFLNNQLTTNHILIPYNIFWLHYPFQSMYLHIYIV